MKHEAGIESLIAVLEKQFGEDTGPWRAYLPALGDR